MNFLLQVFNWSGYNDLFVKGDINSIGFGSGEYVHTNNLFITLICCHIIVSEALTVYGLTLIYIMAVLVQPKHLTVNHYHPMKIL